MVPFLFGIAGKIRKEKRNENALGGKQMPRELRQDAVVDSFKKELRHLGFVREADYPEIEQLLDILADRRQIRFSKTEAAKRLWKFFFERSLGDITPNLRGYDKLCRYFDDFVNYENLLFALDKSHRDHVIHSIWVMLIGFYLRKNFQPFSHMDYVSITGLGPKEEQPQSVKETKDILRACESSLWCLVALGHDLGYPIEKTRYANEIMANMVRNFGLLEQRDFQYNFTVVHQTAIDELLNTISAFVVWEAAEGYSVTYYSGLRMDYAKSFEQLDHGIMSAYLLHRNLDFVCGKMGTVLRGPLGLRQTDKKRAADTALVIELMRAISAHTNNNCYWSSADNMDVLLFLSDELDEFSRYSRSLTTNEWVELGCRTEFECTKGSLKVNYTFDNPDIADDMELFFKGKVERLHNRFELQDDHITKIFVTCKDVRKAEPVVFGYKKTLSEHPRGIVERTPGKSSRDIQGFLEGTVSLL